VFDEGGVKAKLPLMARRRLAVFGVLVAAACGGSDDARSSGASTSMIEVDSTPVAVNGMWPDELGTVLIVPSDTENLAVVLYPASLAADIDPKTLLNLFGSGADPVRTRVSVTSLDTVHCGDAPLVRLGRATPQSWTLGVGGSTATWMRADSIESLSSTDSLAYSVAAAQMASAVTAGNGSRFGGLSFSLASVRRIRIGDTTVIAAQLVRRVNQEANPAEERTFVVGERTSKSPFEVGYSDRSEGTEETAAHYDVIGAFRSGSSTYLVVATETANGTTINILERVRGTWSLRWTRSIVC
jgi:hypothetical protein